MRSEEITEEIKAYIARGGGKASSWYVGIASNTTKVFSEHKVDKVNGAWIYRQIDVGASMETAIGSLRDAGCDIAPGTNDEAGNFLYAYLKTTETNP